MKIYLAGGLKDGWQEQIPSGWDVLDPRTWQDPDPAIYTARDLQAIRQSDAVLAYMDSANPSGLGMSLEVGYAHGLGKRVLFIDGIGGDWRSRYFGMHRSICEVFPDVYSALRALRRMD